MLIAHISDNHGLDCAETRLEDLKHYVHHINQLEPAPDLVVHTGDIAHNGKPEEYALAAGALRQLKVPLSVLPGNRDDRDAFRAAFADLVPANCHERFVQYVLRTPENALIMLDTVSADSNMGRLCPARLAHFEDLLRASADVPAVIFMHHPTFEITASKYPLQFEDAGNAQTFAEIVARHPNVRSIHCGHSHRLATGKVADVDAATVPSLAADLRLGGPLDANDIVNLINTR